MLCLCICSLATIRALNFVKSQGQWFLVRFGQRCQLWLSLRCVRTYVCVCNYVPMFQCVYVCMAVCLVLGVWLTQEVATPLSLANRGVEGQRTKAACCASALFVLPSVCLSVWILRIMGSSAICICMRLYVHVCVRVYIAQETSGKWHTASQRFISFASSLSFCDRSACLDDCPCKRFMNPQWRTLHRAKVTNSNKKGARRCSVTAAAEAVASKKAQKRSSSIHIFLLFAST